MKQILLKIDETEIRDNDVLLFRDGEFKHIQKSAFLKELNNEIKSIKENISKLETSLKTLENAITLINTELAYNRGDITEEEFNSEDKPISEDNPINEEEII